MRKIKSLLMLLLLGTAFILTLPQDVRGTQPDYNYVQATNDVTPTLSTEAVTSDAEDSQSELSAGDEQGQQESTLVLIATVTLGIIELLARIVPTSKNWTVTGFLYNIIGFIIPNRTGDGKKLTINKKE